MRIISSKLISYILVIIIALFITKYYDYFSPQNLLHQKKAYTLANSLEFIPINDAFGPESFTFGPNGDGPYAGVSNGRIIKWVGHLRRWEDFAFTSLHREKCENPQNHEEIEHECGRPLGLRFNEKSGELYIADAYMGLMVVGLNGGLARKVVTEVDGIPLTFANALDIDQHSGIVYFTSSTTRFPRRKYMSVILSKDKTGRVLKYNPTTNKTTTLLQNLSFPNGLSLSLNNDFILIVETTTCKVLRHWLHQNPSHRDQTELFTDLPGFGDNIKMNSKGEFWVGIYSKREPFLKWVMSFSWVGDFILNLPFDFGFKLVEIISKFKAIGLGVKLDQEGKIVKTLEVKSGKLKYVSEVFEKDGDLWFGSVILPFVALYKDYNNSSF